MSHLQLIGKNGKRITLRLPPYIRKLSGYRETPDGLILTALKKKHSQILYIRLKGNLGVFLLDTVPIGESHDTPKKVRDYLMTWEILGQFGDFHIYKTCDRQDSVLLISPVPIQQLNSAVLNGRTLEIGKEYPDTRFIEIPYKSPQ